MWAIVEIMGHRTRAGLIGDATLGGATMLRIEHPTRRDHSGNEPLCEYYAPQAIFAIRPCSPEDAATVTGWAWTDTQPGRGLPYELEAIVDPDADFDDELDRVS